MGLCPHDRRPRRGARGGARSPPPGRRDPPAPRGAQLQAAGVTGVALLAESHLAVHTWPEQGYVAADIYTCGTTAEPNKAVRVLERCFGAKLVESS
ncbi:MAG: adenosylmethionine decarboxylase [Gemmatimonas sp.]|nr:adenosylmethionine decarboxylase [Gemmatimonas sp.]